jgi:CheY-like chemotaxis protein
VSGPRILSLEDQVETIDGTLTKLRRLGWAVVREFDFEGGETSLRGERFDLLLVDQRLPRGGQIDWGAGTDLMARLKSGGLGSANADTPFVFVTAVPEHVHKLVVEENVAALPGYLGVEPKGGDLTPRVTRIADQVLASESPLVKSHDVYDALVEARQIETRGSRQFARVTIPAWRPEHEVAIDFDTLPEAVQYELESSSFPVFLICTLNLAARTPQELDLRDFEIAPAAGADERLE